MKYDSASGEKILVVVEFRSEIKLRLSGPKLADFGAKSQVWNSQQEKSKNGATQYQHGMAWP